MKKLIAAAALVLVVGVAGAGTITVTNLLTLTWPDTNTLGVLQRSLDQHYPYPTNQVGSQYQARFQAWIGLNNSNLIRGMYLDRFNLEASAAAEAARTNALAGSTNNVVQ